MKCCWHVGRRDSARWAESLLGFCPMGRIFDRAGPHAYGELCAAAARRETKVKLSRAGSAWTLELVASPWKGDSSWRAAAVLFAEISELDAQAGHLLRWLES